MNKFDAHNNTGLFKLKRLRGYNPHTQEAIDGFKRNDKQKKQRKSYKT
jgi:hypothetical protein